MPACLPALNKRLLCVYRVQAYVERAMAYVTHGRSEISDYRSVKNFSIQLTRHFAA